MGLCRLLESASLGLKPAAFVNPSQKYLQLSSLYKAATLSHLSRLSSPPLLGKVTGGVLALRPPKLHKLQGPRLSSRVFSARGGPMESSSQSASVLVQATATVIIWLHGLGDTGAGWDDLQHNYGGPAFQNVKWIFPTAPIAPVTCNGGYRMNSWFDLPEIPITKDSPNVDEEVRRAVRRVHAMIDEQVAAGVSPSRILIGGFSQGGALTLASTMTYPETLMGAVVFSGWVPFADTVFLDSITDNAKKTPVLWCHGKADNTVLLTAGQRAVPLLTTAGVSYTFKAYPGMAHTAGVDQLVLLKDWILERLGQPSAA